MNGARMHVTIVRDTADPSERGLSGHVRIPIHGVTFGRASCPHDSRPNFALLARIDVFAAPMLSYLS